MNNERSCVPVRRMPEAVNPASRWTYPVDVVSASVAQTIPAASEYLSPFNARVVAANIYEAVISLAEGQCDLMVCYGMQAHRSCSTRKVHQPFTGK